MLQMLLHKKREISKENLVGYDGNSYKFADLNTFP